MPEQPVYGHLKITCPVGVATALSMLIRNYRCELLASSVLLSENCKWKSRKLTYLRWREESRCLCSVKHLLSVGVSEVISQSGYRRTARTAIRSLRQNKLAYHVATMFKLTDCDNGTEHGSFAFVKNRRFIGFRHASPSIRRPVSVKNVFLLLSCKGVFLFLFSLSFLWSSLHSSRAASVAILPSALFLSDFRSVQVGRTRFSRCCYLIIDLGSHLFNGSWART
jgi:hypothetical protein